MPKIFFPLLLVALCLQLPGVSEAIVLKGAPDASVDYGRLDRVDELVDGYIGKGWLNGMVVLVVKDNQLIRYKGYGYADKESKKPCPPTRCSGWLPRLRRSSAWGS